MIWLTGIISFAVGMCAGAILFKQLKSDAAKVRELQAKLEKLQAEHEDYKQSVHTHFNTTAQLFHQLTDSYRDVYNHLAAGAHSLCPDNISSQLAPSEQNRELLNAARPPQTSGGPPEGEETARYTPPRDYADKTGPNQKGSLAEDYGLHRE